MPFGFWLRNPKNDNKFRYERIQPIISTLILSIELKFLDEYSCDFAAIVIAISNGHNMLEVMYRTASLN